MTAIYHITSRADWQAAQKLGAYRTPSLEREGFIHASRADQVLKVANAFYRAQAGLVLLQIDPALLQAVLKWEPPVHPQPGEQLPPDTDRFPHIYGPINLDAVIRVVDFPVNVDGSFSWTVDA